MHHEYSTSTDKYNRQQFTNANKDYMFDYNLGSVRCVGVEPNPPKRKYIGIGERFELLNEELKEYKIHFVTELHKMAVFNQKFDINLIIDELNHVEKLISRRYDEYLDEDHDRVFIALKDIKNNKLELLKSEVRHFEKIEVFINGFIKLKDKLIKYLDMAEEEQRIKFATINKFVHKMMEPHMNGQYILSDEEFEQLRSELIHQINNIHIIT